MAKKQFTYKHEQSIAENIRNLGLCYKIRYGLNYSFSENTSFGAEKVGEYSFRSLEEPIVGEQLLRKASISHINAIYGTQRKLLLASATRLFEHPDNTEHKYWEDFDACYQMFMKPADEEKPEDSETEGEKAEDEDEDDKVKYTAAIAAEINDILDDQSEWLEECEATVQEVADAVLCYFLTKRSNDATVWDLELLTSQTDGIKRALRIFMNEQIGIQTQAGEQENAPDTKGVGTNSSPEDTTAPKR